MRPYRRARWPSCAIALLLCSPAAVADDGKPPRSKKRSIEACASFQQHDRDDEDGVDFTLASSCDVKLSCGIKWTLTCAPGTKKASRRREQAVFTLEDGQREVVTASAARCGFDGWEMSAISWSCEPQP